MFGSFVFGGNLRIVGEFETKTGKKVYKFIDDDEGKVIRVVVSSSLLNGNAGSYSKYALRGLKFYKNGFDVLELVGEVLEGVED